MEIIFLIGRIILGGYLLLNAYNHLFKLSDLSSYAEARGVPMPKVSVLVSGLLLLLGGFSVLTGMYTEVGIWALVLFFIPVTFTMHAFWKEQGQETKASSKVEFLKNLAVLGALLMLLAVPTPWPLTLG